MDPHLYTKVLADQAQSLCSEEQETIRGTINPGAFTLPPGRDCQMVIGDFLRRVREAFEADMMEQWNLDVLPPIDWWVTMPVAWPVQAEDLMRDAVGDAQFGAREGDRVFYLSEAEAAMASVAVDQITTQRAGQVVLVCDCGGATADLGCLVVDRVEPLDCRALTGVTGTTCGAIMVDQPLFSYTKDLIARTASWEIPDWAIRGAVTIAKERFAGVRPVPVRFPPLICRTRAQSRFQPLVTVEVMAEAFNPVVDRIVDTIFDQLIEASRRSAYVRARIGRHLRQFYPEIEVIYGEHPVTAVGRGATYHGLWASRPRQYESQHQYGLAISTLTPQDTWSFTTTQTEHPILHPGRIYASGEQGDLTATVTFQDGDPIWLAVFERANGQEGKVVAHIRCDSSRINQCHLSSLRTNQTTVYRLDVRIRWQIRITMWRALEWT
ncbi:hypothetical protein BO71DRAFT_489625, partial [Aspergillus ellipticus CBS 707.79]